MPDETQPQSRLWGKGAVVLRRRPTLLLMTVPLFAPGATLELKLINLKKQCAATKQWLQQQGAMRVEFGEPHFFGAADKDPMKHMRAGMARRLRQVGVKPTTTENKREVRLVVTALWDIAAMSAEEMLVFVDRLQFETAAAGEEPAPEPAEEARTWESPEKQMSDMMANMASMVEPPELDRSAQFLFITRLEKEDLARAYAEAYTLAQQDVELLAKVLNRRLGNLVLSNCAIDKQNHHHHALVMERQHCMGTLGDSTFDLAENEIVSDNPKSVPFHIKVDLHYTGFSLTIED